MNVEEELILKYRNYFIFIMTAVLFTVFNFVEVQAKAKPPQVTADAVMLIDNNSGKVLYEKNPDKRKHPASLTKIMTAILVLEDNNNNRDITISRRAGQTPYASYAYAGQVIRQFDMLTQMLLISDNVAASALAEAVGGSEKKFARLMNNKARAIGAVSTRFVNPHGLTASGHYTTARDMAKIAAYAMKKPLFRRIVGAQSIYVNSVYPYGETLFCENTNELVYDYAGCTGVKTGWTNAAGGCIVASASRNNHELMVVLLQCASREQRFSEAAAMLDYGFDLSDANGR